MAKLTCTEKAWDSARPSSVKKTGLGDAIAKALKVLPGGDTDRLDTLAACDKARPFLVSLQDTLKSAHTSVSKASDDKKDAATLLKGWQTEVGKVLEALNQRQFKLIEDIVSPVLDEWTKPRADYELKVQSICNEVRKADNNKGHSEQMIQQAVFAMIERAGKLKEMGAVDSLDPEDYLIDKEFKESHLMWREMVALGLATTRKLEELVKDSKLLSKDIEGLHDAVVDAEKKAGDGLQLDSPTIRKFKLFAKDAREFWNESITDGAAKYATFRFISDPIPDSGSFEAGMKKALLKDFTRLNKIDAEKYFADQMAIYGLNEDRLKKTLQTVQAAQKQLQTLVGTAELAKKEGGKDEEAVKKITALAGVLDETNKKLVKARNNMTVIQALSKDVNKDMKLKIDKVLEFVAGVTKAAQQAADELQ